MAKSMFGHLLPATVIGGQLPQVYKLLQISTNDCLDKKRLFDENAESDWSNLALRSVRATSKRVLLKKYFWVAYVKDELDLVCRYRLKLD